MTRKILGPWWGFAKPEDVGQVKIQCRVHINIFHKLHICDLLAICAAGTLVVLYEYRSIVGKCNYVQPKAARGSLQDLQRYVSLNTHQGHTFERSHQLLFLLVYP